MRLYIACKTETAKAVKLKIELDEETTVASLTSEIAHVVGNNDSLAFNLVRLDGTAFEPALTVVSSGIKNGDTLLLKPIVCKAAKSNRPQLASEQVLRHKQSYILRVRRAGESTKDFPLGSLETSVGRGTANQVVLPYPDLSREHFTVVLAPRLAVKGKVDIPGNAAQENNLLHLGQKFWAGKTQFQILRVSGNNEMVEADYGYHYHPEPKELVKPEPCQVTLPKIPQKSSAGYVGSLLVTPLIMALFVYYFSPGSANVTYLLAMPAAAMVLISGRIVFQFLKLKQQRKHYRQEIRRAIRKIEAHNYADASYRDQIFPRITEIRAAIEDLNAPLWQRRTDDPEFLAVRVGTAYQIPRVEMNDPNQNNGEADRLYRRKDQDLHQKALKQVWKQPLMPVVINLVDAGQIGLYGKGFDVSLNALILQLVGLHGPEALRLFSIRKDDADLEWLTWLPHTRPTVRLGQQLVMHQAEALPETLETLQREIRARKQRQQQLARDGIEGRIWGKSENTGRDWRRYSRTPDEVISVPEETSKDDEQARDTYADEPAVVVLVDARSFQSEHELHEILNAGPEVGIYVIWYAHNKKQLPNSVRNTLCCESMHRGRLHNIHREFAIRDIQLETLDTNASEMSAKTLATVRHFKPIPGSEIGLPAKIGFLELKKTQLTPESVLGNWARLGSGIPAELGHDGDRVIGIDLVKHGPHALVGGTTGSGKSEFLQTWVAALSLLNSPMKLNFLFVDYKGGAAFAPFLQLPHTVGMITDLDPRLVQRVLIALRAELKKRERKFQAAGQKDLTTWEETDPMHAPPRLVIMVDEFATLINEVPDFITGMIDIAARGRSLGIHLVLATQRPAGVITDNLRANMNLKMALRTASEQDSLEIIEDARAAFFPQESPGRVAVKAGAGATHSFQTGYLGGISDTEYNRIRIHVRKEGRWEKHETLRLPVAVGASKPSDLEIFSRTLEIVAQNWKSAHPTWHLERPWLPELATSYALEKLSGCIGVIDKPEQQRQEPYKYEAESTGNLLVVGIHGSGVTCAMRSLVLTQPEILTFVLNGGDSRLSELGKQQSIPVAEADNLEAIVRIIYEVDQNFSALNPTPKLLVIHDYLRIKGMLAGSKRERIWHQLERIINRGRSVGITVICSLRKVSDLPSNQIANFPHKLLLQLGDKEEYLRFGIKTEKIPAECVPGRGYLDGEEIQVAIPGGQIDEALQQEATAKHWQVSRRVRHRLQLLPADLPLSVIPKRAGKITLGVAQTTLKNIYLDTEGGLIISGPARSGKMETLKLLAAQLAGQGKQIDVIGIGIAQTNAALCSRIYIETKEELWQWCEAIQNEDIAPPDALLVPVLANVAQTSLEGKLEQIMRSLLLAGKTVVATNKSQNWNATYSITQLLKSQQRAILLQPAPGEVETLCNANGIELLPPRRPGLGVYIQHGQVTGIGIAKTLHIPQISTSDSRGYINGDEDS